MDLMKIGTQMLMSKMMGGNTNMASAALGNLLGGGDKGPDLGGLLSKMQGDSGLAGLASSWLGTGSNEQPTSDQLLSLFGKEKVAQFATEMGVDETTALSGLKEAIPNMVDKASPEGNLLDAVGGLGGLMNMAGKFMK